MTGKAPDADDHGDGFPGPGQQVGSQEPQWGGAETPVWPEATGLPVRGHVPDLRSLLDPTGPVPHGGFVMRPSLRAATGQMLTVIAYLVMLGIPSLVVGRLAAGNLDLSPEALVGLLLAAVGLALAGLYPILIAVVAPFLQLGFTRYVLDQDGIHVRTRILASKEQRVPWEKVTSVTHRRSVFDSVLGIERLDVVAYGARGTTLHLVGLRNAASLRNLVALRMRQSASFESFLRRD